MMKLTSSLEKIARERQKQQNAMNQQAHKNSAASSVAANVIHDVKLSKKNSIFAYLEQLLSPDQAHRNINLEFGPKTSGTGEVAVLGTESTELNPVTVPNQWTEQSNDQEGINEVPSRYESKATVSLLQTPSIEDIVIKSIEQLKNALNNSQPSQMSEIVTKLISDCNLKKKSKKKPVFKTLNATKRIQALHDKNLSPSTQYRGSSNYSQLTKFYLD